MSDKKEDKAQANEKIPLKKKRSKRRRKREHTKSQASTPLKKEQGTDRIEQAIRLIDSVVRAEAQNLGILRLAPLHLDFIIGDGDSLNQASSDEAIQKQVAKLRQRIIESIHTQVPTQWRRGTVYCFNSEQALTPPSYDSVFTGYDAVGRPQWTRLLPLCLQMQVKGLDVLYAQPPKALSILMRSPIGEPLIPEITEGRVYETLAQLVIGPLSSSFRPLRDQDERHTLTAQLILSKPMERRLSVHLNVLGLNPDEIYEGAAKSAPRGPLARASNSILSAQKEVRKLQELLNLGRLNHDQLPSEAEQILNGLRDSLFRVINGDRQRTQHGKHRHHSMQRPTSEAWRDVKKAGKERLFWDHHQDTVVAIGPKSRVHIFNFEGQHITSMRLGAGELERKCGQGRWRPLVGDRAQRFRACLDKSIPRDSHNR